MQNNEIIDNHIPFDNEYIIEYNNKFKEENSENLIKNYNVKESENNIIKHLVLSGGGPIMIKILGSLKYLEENSFFNMKNIKSIYGTSAGGLLGVLLCLGYDWQTLIDYIIKRPWGDLFYIKIQNIFDSYSKRGIFDRDIIEKALKPLFAAKDIDININLQDFFELTKIELHMYSFEINSYEIIDISYKNYPKLEVFTAIQMTCGLPILIVPVIMDNKVYIDGGFVCNYPLNNCLENNPNENEILAFRNKHNNESNKIDNNNTLLEYLLNFILKSLFSKNMDGSQKNIKNMIICDGKYLNLDYLNKIINNSEIRMELLQNGIELGKLFLDNYSMI